MIRSSFLMFCLYLSSILHGQMDVLEQELNTNWSFRGQYDSEWFSAKVPGTVHTDLMRHGKIPNPFVGNNEAEVQWVSDSSWVYRCVFEPSAAQLSKHHQVLRFSGIDTYAEIRLNDAFLLFTDNAFTSYTADVSGLLKPKNILEIHFTAPAVKENVAQLKQPHVLPEGPRIFTRKPQFQYGWDWGPKLNTQGITQPLKLISWNHARMESVRVVQQTLNDNRAVLQAVVEGKQLADSTISYRLYVDGVPHPISTFERNEKGSQLVFEIAKPIRWWPHNIGKPHLYDIKIDLLRDGEPIDSYTCRKGLRTVELVQEKDKHGSSFYFKVNDVPIFMKGANYIPQHSFQPEVGRDDYQGILEAAKTANMNMLRVWGGGIYEQDIFYDICDELGIMVWQDFMFACAMYPGDTKFFGRVAREAEEQLKRLSDHACLALWCGNNESSEGWHRWGWQAERGAAEKARIWEDYSYLFKILLPKLVAEHGAGLAYWESSPSYGRGDKRYIGTGDAHDWWVWHDAYPFEHFEAQVPRFMSEFGFQSFPGFQAVRDILARDTVDVYAADFQSHQKHHRGYELIRTYMERDYLVELASKDYIYLSQLVQARGIAMGIEAHRRARPYTMGSLYWQLNDCWPVVSWSSIDFTGTWKALHYQAKRSFENTMISSRLRQDSLDIYVVNDERQPLEAKMELTLMDFYGRVYRRDSIQVQAQANSSTRVLQLDVSAYGSVRHQRVIRVRMQDMERLIYLVPPKDLDLPKSELSVAQQPVEGGVEVIIQAKSLQKDVMFMTRTAGNFSDNAFDVLPHEPVRIFFKTEEKALKDLEYFSLNGY